MLLFLFVGGFIYVAKPILRLMVFITISYTQLIDKTQLYLHTVHVMCLKLKNYPK